MPLTAAQIQVFFENPDGMAIPHETVAQLDVEGISHPQDLVEFNKDSLKQVASNLRNPGGRVPNPDPNAPAGATIARPPFVFGANSSSS